MSSPIAGRTQFPGTRLAVAAGVLGVAFAAVSLYWAVGGTALVSTIGGALAARGRSGDPLILGAVWASVVLKLVAAVLGIAMVRNWAGGVVGRLTAVASWTAAVILTGYGMVLTGGGLLVVSGIITASADADLTALRWHAFFWDPWFLIWGLLLLVALIRARRSRTGH